MERAFVDWLQQRLPPHPLLKLGVGDDTAVLQQTDGDTLVTVDMLSDRVDFDISRDDPRRIGRKSLAVNLSDIAAMAGTPTAAVVALTLPAAGGRELAQELFEGMLPLAEQFQVAIAGGDTNSWDGPLVISVTVLGTPGEKGPLTRSGAQPGDRILVTGPLGGSIRGKQFDFDPRLREAQQLHAAYTLHAGIDISDGLAIDLSRLAQASHCGAVLERDRIPIDDAARACAAEDSRTPLEHALGDGEDFELILAAPAEAAELMIVASGVPLFDVGQFVEEPGLWQSDAQGRRPLEPAGFEHRLS